QSGHVPDGNTRAVRCAMLDELLRGRTRVLEVGCGAGALALRLADAGHEVTAIDLHIDGPPPHPRVRFVTGDFRAFTGGPFDAVLFTSSLHHIAPLDAAVARAHDLLAPGGLLWADEFDLEAPDEATARWFYQGQGDVARWRAEHEHEPALHVGAAMIA